MNVNKELLELKKTRLLPDHNYLSSKRFWCDFESSYDFWASLVVTVAYPFANALAACYYAARAVWAMLGTVGNLLIAKPKYAVDALNDMCAQITLSVCLAVMAPIHALTDAMELLTRILYAWIVGVEPETDLSKDGLFATFAKEINKYPNTLPSAAYFKSTRFFSTYKEAMDCIEQAASPLAITCRSGFSSLAQAAKAVLAAINLITNTVICKPLHVLENLRDLGVHTTLALALAIMTPINALIEGIAFVTRLGTTWGEACMKDYSEDQAPKMGA